MVPAAVRGLEVNHDALIRGAALVAAAALLAAPYRGQIASWLSQAAKAAGRHRATAGRIAAAALIVAAAWGVVPIPTLPAKVPTVNVDTPSASMRELVGPVAKAMRGMSAADRALWAQVWTKAGVVVAGDAVTTEVVFTDTRSLRMFTALALDIAWRRIGAHQPGSNEPLRQAVEAAYGSAIGTEVLPVTADVRTTYGELANALAWAGLNGG